MTDRDAEKWRASPGLMACKLQANSYKFSRIADPAIAAVCLAAVARGAGVKLVTIRQSTPQDGARAVDIWCAAVDATHDFFSSADRIAIEEEVRTFLPCAPLWLAVDAHDQPLAFMLLDGGKMEALFVDPQVWRRGVGRALVQHALSLNTALETDVNEANAQAVGFYERLGFKRTGRSEVDGQGRPYPLIHLMLSTNG